MGSPEVKETAGKRYGRATKGPGRAGDEGVVEGGTEPARRKVDR